MNVVNQTTPFVSPDDIFRYPDTAAFFLFGLISLLLGCGVVTLFSVNAYRHRASNQITFARMCIIFANITAFTAIVGIMVQLYTFGLPKQVFALKNLSVNINSLLLLFANFQILIMFGVASPLKLLTKRNVVYFQAFATISHFVLCGPSYMRYFVNDDGIPLFINYVDIGFSIWHFVSVTYEIMQMLYLFYYIQKNMAVFSQSNNDTSHLTDQTILFNQHLLSSVCVASLCGIVYFVSVWLDDRSANKANDFSDVKYTFQFELAALSLLSIYSFLVGLLVEDLVTMQVPSRRLSFSIGISLSAVDMDINRPHNTASTANAKNLPIDTGIDGYAESRASSSLISSVI